MEDHTLKEIHNHRVLRGKTHMHVNRCRNNTSRLKMAAVFVAVFMYALLQGTMIRFSTVVIYLYIAIYVSVGMCTASSYSPPAALVTPNMPILLNFILRLISFALQCSVIL